MLLCDLDHLEEGMCVAAPVYNPRRPEAELLETGVVLDAHLIARLKQLEVASVWVHHDATADLDRLIDPQLGKARHAAYTQLKQDFGQLAQHTVSAAQVQVYRQVIMDLVCELIGGKRVAGLTEQLIGGPPSLFTHGANVAYLSILAGLELETYVVRERAKLNVIHARDMTNLGVGAMLHDLGKLDLPDDVARHHELTPPSPRPDAEPGQDPLSLYRSHPLRGYQMLRGSRAPASATQILLTHHQRWNGQGFPDMADVTDQRRAGAQQGSAIHIFSRIVAAANTLDNLLHDAKGALRPPVAALHDLASDRFTGWFDPIVLDSMLRTMPPFAIGSRVTLSDGRSAAVVAPSIEQPCRPTVRLLSEADRLPDGQYPSLDLSQHPDLRIVECGGHHVEPYLFTLPHRKPLSWQAAEVPNPESRVLS